MFIGPFDGVKLTNVQEEDGAPRLLLHSNQLIRIPYPTNNPVYDSSICASSSLIQVLTPPFTQHIHLVLVWPPRLPARASPTSSRVAGPPRHTARTSGPTSLTFTTPHARWVCSFWGSAWAASRDPLRLSATPRVQCLVTMHAPFTSPPWFILCIL